MAEEGRSFHEGRISTNERNRNAKEEAEDKGMDEAKEEMEGEPVGTFMISFSDAWKGARWQRTPKALRLLKAFIIRNLKVEPENLRISQDLNELLWKGSIEKPPRRIRVTVIRDEEGIYTLYPAKK
ncbi:50S ribosomal protein L31e [Candidatus Bathyarchaeota archaeon]|nr:50S ribosomal protein L31e [Candidatus Bathyarchaeota archaeon]